MREYMRRYREKHGSGTGTQTYEESFADYTADALYVPGRDAPLMFESLAAELMGDPPLGRRAIDAQ